MNLGCKQTNGKRKSEKGEHIYPFFKSEFVRSEISSPFEKGEWILAKSSIAISIHMYAILYVLSIYK